MEVSHVIQEWIDQIAIAGSDFEHSLLFAGGDDTHHQMSLSQTPTKASKRRRGSNQAEDDSWALEETPRALQCMLLINDTRLISPQTTYLSFLPQNYSSDHRRDDVVIRVTVLVSLIDHGRQLLTARKCYNSRYRTIRYVVDDDNRFLTLDINL